MAWSFASSTLKLSPGVFFNNPSWVTIPLLPYLLGDQGVGKVQTMNQSHLDLMYKCTQQAWIYPSKQRCWHVGLPSCKLTWPWNIGLFEDACPIEHGDLPSLVFVYQSVCSDHLESIWIYLFFSPKSPHSYNALPETSHACRSWNGRFFFLEKKKG